LADVVVNVRDDPHQYNLTLQFYTIYTQHFGSPQQLPDYLIEISENLSNTSFKLPYWGTHRYNSGPHSAPVAFCVWRSIFDMSGLDYSIYPENDRAVLAIGDGEVIGMRPLSYRNEPSGLWVAILHPGNIVSLYWHMESYSSVLASMWSPGTRLPVRQGFYLGETGNTGNDPTMPVHYHLEFRAYDPTLDYRYNYGLPIAASGYMMLDGWNFFPAYKPGDSLQHLNYEGSAVRVGTSVINKQFQSKSCSDKSINSVVEIGFPHSNETDTEKTKFANKAGTNNNLTSTQVMACLPQADSSSLIKTSGTPDSSCEPGTGDSTPPTASFTAPANGATITSRVLTVSANASDNSGGSGVREVRFSAKYGGNWYGIGADSSSPYSINWDMCTSGVPKGSVELGLEAWDNAGNKYVYSWDHTNPSITLNYNCDEDWLPSPGSWNAEAWMNKYMAGYVNKNEKWADLYIDKDWGHNAPYPDFPANEFSFKIYRDINFQGGRYYFRVFSDDGFRLLVDGQTRINQWWDQRGGASTEVDLSPGWHPVEIQYYENQGEAAINLWFWGPGIPRPELDPPEGKITSPTKDSYTKQNPLSIYAEAWDDVSGVKSVKFKVYHCVGGCQWRDISTAYSLPYTANLDTSNLDGQQIKLAIDVTDHSGKTRNSAGGEITVYVDRTHPSVAFVSPSPSSIIEDKLLDISVSASDSESGISHIKFFAGYENENSYWQEIGSDDHPADGWGMRWDATRFKDGTLVHLSALAFDKAGNQQSSFLFDVTLGSQQTFLVYIPTVTHLATSPAPQPEKPKIAFVSDRDGNKEIYLINTDKTGLKRLTNDSAADIDPDFSPDGRKIVFTSSRNGYYQIYTMNSDGSEQTRLLASQAADSSPLWSPNGEKIAFTRLVVTDAVRSEVFVMNSDGSGVTQFTATVGNSGDYHHGCWSSDWSSDSTKILYYCYVGHNQIWSMNIDGTDKKLLVNDLYWNSDPSMSPDGSKIAFVSWRFGNYDVYTMNSDGSSLMRITTDPTDEWAVNWSKDGKKLLFEANRDGITQVYWMDADGTQQERISDNSSYAGQPAWKP
jgi:hypothetical protein